MKKLGKTQRQKSYVERVQGLRRSNATTRHRSPRDYQRKPKHRGSWGD